MLADSLKESWMAVGCPGCGLGPQILGELLVIFSTLPSILRELLEDRNLILSILVLSLAMSTFDTCLENRLFFSGVSVSNSSRLHKFVEGTL